MDTTSTIKAETAAKEIIKRHEGFSRGPYVCTSGKLTIGYGRNLSDCGINEMEAATLLSNDVRACVRDLYRIFPGFRGLSYIRRAALIDMRYNLGPGGFRMFKKMIEAIRAKAFSYAAAEIVRSKWFTQVGKRGRDIECMIRSDSMPVD